MILEDSYLDFRSLNDCGNIHLELERLNDLIDDLIERGLF